MTPETNTAAMAEKNERNARVQARYDELMAEGKRGHYETMFRVVREELDAALLRAGVAKAPDVPEGWKLIAVNQGFDDLMYWLGRCEDKGHLENCSDLIEPWSSFDYRDTFTLPSPDAGAVAAECEEVCVRIAVTHQQAEGAYAAGKKAGALECADTIRQRFGVGE